MSMGLRGLSAGSTLARLLAEQRGKRHPRLLNALSIKGILQWADAFFERSGEWPMATSGLIHESPGDNWNMVHVALIKGHRGLRGGISLPQLLAARRWQNCSVSSVAIGTSRRYRD